MGLVQSGYFVDEHSLWTKGRCGSSNADIRRFWSKKNIFISYLIKIILMRKITSNKERIIIWRLRIDFFNKS